MLLVAESGWRVKEDRGEGQAGLEGVGRWNLALGYSFSERGRKCVRERLKVRLRVRIVADPAFHIERIA